MSIYFFLKFNGIIDWLLIRITSIFSLISIFSIVKFILFTKDISYSLWKYYFSLNSVKFLIIFFLINIFIHSWIGIWQVITDYISNYFLNILTQFFCFFLFIIYMFYEINVIIKV